MYLYQHYQQLHMECDSDHLAAFDPTSW